MNTFNVTHKNSAKAVAIFFIIVVAIALITGCGNDDNPTGNNGNPPPSETPIIAFDTLLVRGISIITDSLHSSVFTKSIRLEFEAENNVPSGNLALMSFKYKVWQEITGNLNGSHSITLTRDSSATTDALIQLFISADTSKYLKVFNAKVYKVN